MDLSLERDQASMYFCRVRCDAVIALRNSLTMVHVRHNGLNDRFFGACEHFGQSDEQFA